MKATHCSIDGCEKPRRKREWCETHYWRWRLYGSTDVATPKAAVRGECSEAACSNPVRAVGLCSLHYSRSRPRDRRNKRRSQPRPVALHANMQAHVEETAGGCWLWTRRLDRDGYGQLAGPDGKQIAAHRLSYIRAKGPILDGLEIDHLCRVRRCINPDHLEAVTHAENMRRAARAKAQRAS